MYVGPFLCRDPTVLSKFAINCTVERGAGKHLNVIVYRNADSQDPNAASKGKGAGEGERGEEEVEMVLERAVSFKEAINFREKFDKFVELGVGGMKKEINELYRRAFASRGERAPYSQAWYTETEMAAKVPTLKPSFSSSSSSSSSL